MAKHGGLVNFEPFRALNPHGFLAKNWNGCIYPPFYHEERIAYLKEHWRPGPLDLFITTHQKVGTHLTKKYVVELLKGSHNYPPENGLGTGDIGHHTVAWPEVLVSQYGTEHFEAHLAKTEGLPRVWYLHSYLDDLPFHNCHAETKFIHIYRDPRGAFTSQFHFYKSHPLLGVAPELDLDHFMDYFLEGALYFGDYFEHTIDWVRRSALKNLNVLSLTYESLVDDKRTSAETLFKFMCPHLEPNESLLEHVVERTAFKTMKQELSEKPQSFHFNTEKFFRAGTSFSWMRELPLKYQQLLEQSAREKWGHYPEISYFKSPNFPL